MKIDAPSLYLRHETFTASSEPITPKLFPSLPQYITLATTTLPLRSLHLTRGLRKNEIALVHNAETFFLTPAGPLPAFRAFITHLHQLILSPPGYTLLSPLASGAFGTVHTAASDTHPRLAIKRVSLSNPFWRTERDILNFLPRHDNVIQLHDSFVYRQSLHLVMPLLSNLSTLKQPLPLSHALSLIKSMLEALAHLHKHRIAHNDIKPDNLLLRGNAGAPEVVLTDFGLSTRGAAARGGTLAYRAPSGSGACADVWSAGVVAFVLITGRLPWSGVHDRAGLVRRMREEGSAKVVGELVGRYCGQECEEVTGLLKGMLQVHPGKRLTARAALQHKVFGGPARVAWSVKRVFRGVLVGVRWLDSWQRGRVGRTLLL